MKTIPYISLPIFLSDPGELLPGDEAVPVLVEQLEGGVGLAGPVAPGGTLGPAHHLNLVTGQGGF